MNPVHCLVPRPSLVQQAAAAAVSAQQAESTGAIAKGPEWQVANSKQMCIYWCFYAKDMMTHVGSCIQQVVFI